MMPRRAWQNIEAAIEHYTRQGFEYVALPWHASREAVVWTIPPGLVPTVTQDKYYLIGSAEQAFIDMMMKGTLAPGSYCACTPCFRDEKEDEFHKKYFMKVELISYARSDAGEAQASLLPGTTWRMVSMAKEFLEALAGPGTIIGKATSEGCDLELAGVEVASFGVRTAQWKDDVIHEWAFGTGLAEPRFSIVKDKL